MNLLNICVIGNSHLGSLKRGWDLMDEARRQRAQPTFFGHRAGRIEGLVVQGDCLVPSNEDLRSSLSFTSGGHETIDPKAYDAVILYGLSAGYWLLPEDKAYSAACLRCAAEDITSDTLSMLTLRKLRQVTPKKIYIGHDPMPAVDGGTWQNPAHYLNGIRRLNEIIYTPMNAELLAQPKATIVNGCNTAIEHSVGSRRLAVGGDRMDEHHDHHDLIHMNDAFGRMWWNDFFNALDAPSDPVS